MITDYLQFCVHQKRSDLVQCSNATRSESSRLRVDQSKTQRERLEFKKQGFYLQTVQVFWTY
jgi:hypothetical protein